MDGFEQFYGNTPGGYHSKRSPRMETAALVLGVIALLCCSCLYLSIPCGALAIIFASLSRGGMMSYTSRAQVGMTLGILALIATGIIYAATIAAALLQYGGVQEFLDAYAQMYGMEDYSEFLQMLGISE